MFEREIEPAFLQSVVESGEIIADYDDDQPYPSKLVLGFLQKRPIHVVVAQNGGDCIIVTAYEPDAKVWNTAFTRRIDK
jgi:hypothetical protein